MFSPANPETGEEYKLVIWINSHMYFEIYEYNIELSLSLAFLIFSFFPQSFIIFIYEYAVFR